jgi:hypothetical protein
MALMDPVIISLISTCIGGLIGYGFERIKKSRQRKRRLEQAYNTTFDALEEAELALNEVLHNAESKDTYIVALSTQLDHDTIHTIRDREPVLARKLTVCKRIIDSYKIVATTLANASLTNQEVVKQRWKKFIDQVSRGHSYIYNLRRLIAANTRLPIRPR